MQTVTISPKYQVVIPKPIRRKLGLCPGQKVQAIAFENRIELVLVRPVRKLRGFLKGIDPRVSRDDDGS
jgi:AbrB family looped-hinge helix DNA binding protein